MPTQEAKAHRVGEWASLRNTSPEIAEAIFELAKYDEKVAEQIWEEGSDAVLELAFSKTDKDALFWGEQTIERKNVCLNAPSARPHGSCGVGVFYTSRAGATNSTSPPAAASVLPPAPAQSTAGNRPRR